MGRRRVTGVWKRRETELSDVGDASGRDRGGEPAPERQDSATGTARAASTRSDQPGLWGPGFGEFWVADITHIPTQSGFLYMALVLDA